MHGIPALFSLISGTVYDSSGAVVAGARVVLLEDYNKLTETQSGDKGDFAFPGLKPGSYQVQIKRPWFQLFQQYVTLRENQDQRIYAVLDVARANTQMGITGSPRPEQPPAARADRPGGRVEGLKRLSGQMPNWPAAASRPGPVVLYSKVRTDGTIADTLVLESPDRELEQAAVAAWNTWEFQPRKLNGRPIECRHLAVFEFRLPAP
jgi:TonB family protein